MPEELNLPLAAMNPKEPKTNAAPLTLAEWRNKIFLTLGGSGWNVELDEQSLDHAIWETLALFNKYRPDWKWLPLGTAARPNMVFELEGKVADGTNIVKVNFQLNSIKFFRPYYYPFLNEYYGLREPRRVAQLFMAHDRYQNFLGTHPSWRWDAPHKLLYVTVEAPITGVNVMALVTIPMSIDQIPYHVAYDFLEGCVGHAKIILARILRKFGPVPSAQGNIDLDANELNSEGTSAIEKLEAKLAKSLKGKPVIGQMY
jgi:hypothetical protein